MPRFDTQERDEGFENELWKVVLICDIALAAPPMIDVLNYCFSPKLKVKQIKEGMHSSQKLTDQMMAILESFEKTLDKLEKTMLPIHRYFTLCDSFSVDGSF